MALWWVWECLRDSGGGFGEYVCEVGYVIRAGGGFELEE